VSVIELEYNAVVVPDGAPYFFISAITDILACEGLDSIALPPNSQNLIRLEAPEATTKHS
jgi:hypothetical protein